MGSQDGVWLGVMNVPHTHTSLYLFIMEVVGCKKEHNAQFSATLLEARVKRVHVDGDDVFPATKAILL